MTFELIGQSAVFGVFIGALYGLGSVGFSFTFGVVRILNIAHGELLMLGGYATFYLFSLYKLDPFLSLPVVGIMLFVVGAILYKVLFCHVVKFSAELRLDTSLLVAFGAILILSQTAVLCFTADERAVTPSYAGLGVRVLNLQFPYVGLGGFVVSAIVIFSLHLFLQKTYVGKAIRATAENWESATLMGINIDKIYLISFGLASALAGLAGCMVVLSYSISPGVGLEWVLKALIVTVLAGVGSVGGAFLAGVLLGVVEAVSAIFLGSYYLVVGLAIFILVLFVKPYGFFGKR